VGLGARVVLQIASLISANLVLVACGGGEGGAGANAPNMIPNPNALVEATANELAVTISGDNRHFSDETYVLTIGLTGSLATSATLSLEDSPSFLELNTQDKVISAQYSVAGEHIVRVSAKSGNKIASATFELIIDASLNARYQGISSSEETSYTTLITRSRKIFWEAAPAGDVNPTLHCWGNFETDTTSAAGTGHCKRLVNDGVAVVRTNFNLNLNEDKVMLNADYQDSSGSLLFSETVNAMTRVTGIYVSTQLGSLRWIQVDTDNILRDVGASGYERVRCQVDAIVSNIDMTDVTVRYDGSINELNGAWDRCDLTDQAGLTIMVGDATGLNEGAIRFYESGPDLYFSAHLAREIPTYQDPVSKMNYVRVCSAGNVTPIAVEYNVNDDVCAQF
jgi:hypothetical protein